MQKTYVFTFTRVTTDSDTQWQSRCQKAAKFINTNCYFCSFLFNETTFLKSSRL